MGAVADAVSDLGSSVSDTVSDVGDFVQDTGQAVIDEVVTPVVESVQKTYDAFEEDPLGTSLKIAAAASGNPMYVMAANTAVAVAHGADLNDALESGAKAGATSWAANTIAEYVSTPEVGSVRGPDNIDVGGGFNPATGAASSTIPIPPKITTEGKIAGSTAANIIQGQDPLTALMNGGISGGTSAITAQIPGYDRLTKEQQSIVNNTVSAALRGGDPSQALVDSALMAGINEAKAQYKESQASGLSAGATGQNESVFDPTYGGALPTTTTAEVPGGTQVASTDGALPTVDVNQMSSPVYADSKTIGDVKAPVGFELMPAALNEKDANGNWLRPEGSYYDMYQNAWFMPSAEDTQSIKDLQAQLQNQPMPEVTTIPDVTTTDTGALPSTPIVDTSVQPSTGGLPATTTEQTVDQMPEIVITDKKDPYTGDIQLDLSGQPTSTVATPTATPTSTAGVSTTAAPTVLGNFPATGSNIGQTTTATPSLGALPTAPNPTMLAAAPLEKQNMVLGELTQLYPQLANVDPRLLQILSGKTKPSSYYNYGQSGGTTPLMNAGSATMPTAGMPFKTSSTSGSSNLAGLTSSSGSGALSRAGLSMLDSNQTISGFAKGGLAEHNPEFITGATGHHVKGAGDGQSDSIPAMLADGEYVFDADTVAALGNGSNDAGARILDKMRQNIRKHKRSAPVGKIPPKAKSPLEYMKG